MGKVAAYMVKSSCNSEKKVEVVKSAYQITATKVQQLNAWLQLQQLKLNLTVINFVTLKIRLR